ncbi:MAG: hypothetical protein QXK26_02035 [Candidatus Bathyarchaeia archaeon]
MAIIKIRSLKRFKEAAENVRITIIEDRKIWHSELPASIFTCKI